MKIVLRTLFLMALINQLALSQSEAEENGDAMAVPAVSIQTEGVDGDIYRYSTDLTDQQIAMLSEERELLAKQLISHLEELISRDVAAGRIGDRSVHFDINIDSDEPGIPNHSNSLIIDLRKMTLSFGDENGILIGVFVHITSQAYQDPEISFDIGEQGQSYFSAAEGIWDVLEDAARDEFGYLPAEDEVANLAIRQAIEGYYENTWPIALALGVWLGNQLIEGNPDLQWVDLTDDSGWNLALVRGYDPQFGRANLHMFPIHMVFKRIDRSEVFDARGLIDVLLDGI